MSKQQTAVDWLYNMMLKPLSQWPDDLWEQAKKMEKQQIKDAYNHAYREVEEDCCKEVGPDIANFANAEDYYNDTYTI
jgi:HEPN domain-containing protein